MEIEEFKDLPPDFRLIVRSGNIKATAKFCEVKGGRVFVKLDQAIDGCTVVFRTDFPVAVDPQYVSLPEKQGEEGSKERKPGRRGTSRGPKTHGRTIPRRAPRRIPGGKKHGPTGRFPKRAPLSDPRVDQAITEARQALKPHPPQLGHLTSPAYFAALVLRRHLRGGTKLARLVAAAQIGTEDYDKGPG